MSGAAGRAERGSGTIAGQPGAPRPPVGLIEYLDLAGDRGPDEKRRAAFAGALLADRLGYSRVWIPEHHAAGSPSSNPLLLASVIASHTARMRIGTACILLRIRDPLLTAEDIATAAAFCDGRLDVGIGRGDFGGPGSERLNYLRKDDRQLQEAIDTVLALLAQGSSAFAPLTVPYELWLHGTGTGSAALAGALSANYCHALFLNPNVDACLRGLDAYRSASRSPGRTAVAISVVVNRDLGKAMSDAARQPFPMTCAGTPEECALTVTSVLSMTGADEVLVAELSAEGSDHLAALTALIDRVASAGLGAGRMV